jgi:predicted component of type VI protein secretion system
MAFKFGVSGNPDGRPKGATNKTSLQLRETINNFLETNFEKVVEDFAKLKPNERVKFYTDLLNYGLPKLQAVQIENDFDSLTDDELDHIINKLKKTNNE